MQAADELRQYMTEVVLQKGDHLFSQVTCTILPLHTCLCWITACSPIQGLSCRSGPVTVSKRKVSCSLPLVAL